ncbi:MAG TPA: GNAT family N-acetyltransferase [Acidobacteriaceae bacterium]|nr:GNAT family N-acetyltransferase [Acidobacteriaceae bacterium]
MSSFPPEMLEAPDGTAIVLRSCQGFGEMEACVRLQIETWGYNDGDVIPRRMFTVAQRIGGQAIGAFDPAGEMVGFAMSIPGMKPTGDPSRPQVPYLHSHMLAVTPRFRNAGIGRRLKLYQRAEAVSRGIRLMEWTFDPLEIKNAHLNIHRLGVIVRTYTPNFYGVSSSRLQAGLPTDRLHAEWWMESERVKAILSGSQYTPPQIQETIMVPKAIAAWKASAERVSGAEAVQAENRERFLAAFSRGLAVTGFRTDNEGNGIYELARLHQPNPGVL